MNVYRVEMAKKEGGSVQVLHLIRAAESCTQLELNLGSDPEFVQLLQAGYILRRIFETIFWR